MAYSPAFQFYSGDFLSDPYTLVMTTEEIGAYSLLILICWEQNNSLPNDVDELAVYARLPIKRFEPMWEKRIKRCFTLDEKKNIYFHDRLRKEIGKQKAFKKRQSEAGKASAEKRKKQKELPPQPNSTTVEPPLNQVATEAQPNSSSHSSFSSSTSVEKEEVRDTPQAATPKRGTRIPEPFYLTSEMREYAKQKRPNVDVELETEKFVNYWRARAGRDATKLDWLATWKNWILSAKENGNGTNQQPYPGKRTDADVKRESADFIAQKFSLVR